jgi:xanthine dehydrogenase small subunit
MPLALKTYPTIAEAGAALKDAGARYIGGGTLVVRATNEGDVSLSTYVLSTDPALLAIKVEGGRATIGASATMSAITSYPGLSAIAKAAKAVGGPAIRNMATVGGNLFAPAPYGDFAVALLALDAQVMVQSGYGSARAMAIEEFLNARERGVSGLVAGVQFARPQNASDFRFRKVSRVKPKGLSVMSIAAHLPNASGRIAQARIAYGAMAPTPVRARGAERALEGKTLDAAAIQAAKAAALEGTRPATDAIATEWYRREVLPVHLGRLLTGEGR